MFRRYLRAAKLRLHMAQMRRFAKPETTAQQMEVSQKTAQHFFVWEEPNRADTPELQIGRSGGRYSTLTGLWWLDAQRFVVNHRSGLKMAVFDLTASDPMIWTDDIPYLSDDIAAKQTGPEQWEIAISGCWDTIYTRHVLDGAGGFTMSLSEDLNHPTRDFCHGVAYDAKGQLCYAIHTGVHPRFAIGDKIHHLPYPWGVRDLCHDPARGRYIAVAVSANPRREAYGGVKTALWTYPETGGKWQCLGVYDNVHSDALDVWGDHIWLPDQVANRLLGIDVKTGDLRIICTGDAFDFPHGLGISDTGQIAVTNYGSSSVAIVDAKTLIG